MAAGYFLMKKTRGVKTKMKKEVILLVTVMAMIVFLLVIMFAEFLHVDESTIRSSCMFLVICVGAIVGYIIILLLHRD